MSSGLAPARSEWIEIVPGRCASTAAFVSLPRGASGLKFWLTSFKALNRFVSLPRGASGLKSQNLRDRGQRTPVSLPRGASGLKSFRRFVNCPAPCLLEGGRGHPIPHKALSHFPPSKKREPDSTTCLALFYFFLRGWFCPRCPPCPAGFPLAAGRPPGCLDAGCLGGAGRSLRGGRGCLGVGSRISMG